MNIQENKYAELLAQTLPGVINNDSEYARLEAVFVELLEKGRDNRDPAEDRMFDLLANLLEDYENRTQAPTRKSSPAENLKFIMDQANLLQKDLADIFGSQGKVSEVLSGKRGISVRAAKSLGERFKVSPALFI